MLSIAGAPALPVRTVEPAEKPIAGPRLIAPSKAPTKEEMRASWRKKNPLLTPAQAVASGAELGPPSGSGRADNSPEKVHTEIKVNGKVVARTYNSGGIEIANEYGFISDELLDSFAADKGGGPELAEARANRFKAALERHGMLPREKLDTNGLLAAALAKTPIVEMLRASTAQTEEEWLEAKSKEAPLDPGAFLSRMA
jgi:hypothetical protein